MGDLGSRLGNRDPHFTLNREGGAEEGATISDEMFWIFNEGGGRLVESSGPSLISESDRSVSAFLGNGYRN